MYKKKVLIIFGGSSTEYYVSCASTGSMMEHIDQSLFDVVTLGVTIEGKWILTRASADEIKDGVSWLEREDNKEAIVSPVKDENTIWIIDGTSILKEKIDCVFPLISGWGGEDGKLQGLLELANIPYVGSSVAASANAMDKHLTRLFVESCGLKQPKCVVLTSNIYNGNIEEVKSQIDFGYPIFVKPASLGSSIGISKVDCEEQLKEAIEKAFKYEEKILLEQGIIGRELKVSIIGNEELEIGAVCELFTAHDVFNDYATKYLTGSSTKKIPAEIGKELDEEVKRQAALIYKELGCKGFARVDFFYSEDGELYFNEINTVPGFSKKSILTLMFEAIGISYTEIITRLINLAFVNKKQVHQISKDGFGEFICM